MKGGLRPELLSLKERRYRRAIGCDYEYGETCPECAGPKSRQALRCRRCYAIACSQDPRRRLGGESQHWPACTV